MRRRSVLVLVVAVAVAAGAAAAVLVLEPGEDGPGPAPRAGNPALCRALADEEARACYAREYLVAVRGRDDPRPAVQAIADAAWREGGSVLTNCHGAMHTVGRTYAREAGVTLANLMDHLPRTGDPGCPAGFAHGLVTGVAPQIDPSRPADAAAVCSGAGTRYRRYSCIHGFGHAFMRIYDDVLEPALDLCRALGPREAPDCAQGAYHDYWFAVAGADGAQLSQDAVTDPRALCESQPEAFVRPCWYRAFVDNRPDGFEVGAPEDIGALCEGLDGLQRKACVTAAAVIGPPDPAAQLEICAGMPSHSDAASCIRGTKVQNLLDSPMSVYVELIGRCELFAATTRSACYRWLGKTLAVLTDGDFGRRGCAELGAADARRHCRAGGRQIEGALVTFS